MSRRASPTLVGVFVLGAIAIAIAGAVGFGGGMLFSSRITYVAYFEGSVGGLAVGAAVDFRGVRIGSVSEIDVRVNTNDSSVRIPVYLDLEPNRVTRIGAEEGPRAIFAELIEERGLKAQLQTQSLVTGQLVVNLDFYPEFEARYLGGDSAYPEMPTIPTNLQQFEKNAREAFAKLSRLPLAEFVNDLQSGVRGFNNLVNSPELERALVNANRTLEDLQGFVQSVEGRVEPLASGVDETLVQAKETLAQAQAMLRSYQDVVADDSELTADLTRALEELAEAARSVRVLADTIERKPEAILRGKGGR